MLDLAGPAAVRVQRQRADAEVAARDPQAAAVWKEILGAEKGKGKEGAHGFGDGKARTGVRGFSIGGGADVEEEGSGARDGKLGAARGLRAGGRRRGGLTCGPGAAERARERDAGRGRWAAGKGEGGG